MADVSSAAAASASAPLGAESAEPELAASSSLEESSSSAAAEASAPAAPQLSEGEEPALGAPLGDDEYDGSAHGANGTYDYDDDEPPPAEYYDPEPQQTMFSVAQMAFEDDAGASIFAERLHPIDDSLVPRECLVRPGSAELFKREARALQRLRSKESTYLPHVRTLAQPVDGVPLSGPPPTYITNVSQMAKARREAGRRAVQASRIPAGATDGPSWVEKEYDSIRYLPAEMAGKVRGPGEPLPTIQSKVKLTKEGRLPPAGASSRRRDVVGFVSREFESLAASQAVPYETLKPSPPAATAPEGVLRSFLLASKRNMRAYKMPPTRSAMAHTATVYARRPALPHHHDSTKLTPSERIACYYTPHAVGLSPRALALPKELRPIVGIIDTGDLPGGEMALARGAMIDEAEGMATNTDAVHAARKANFMPLEIFDDEEHEPFTLAAWNALSIDNPMRAKTPLYRKSTDKWGWEPCDVIGYDPSTRTFAVVMHANAQTRTAKRMNLMFDDEDEDAFHRRIAFARAEREITESAARLKSYIDDLTGQEVVHTFDYVGLLAAVARSAAGVSRAATESAATYVINEIREAYEKAIKLASLQYRRLDSQETAKLAILRLPNLPAAPAAPPRGQLPLLDDWSIWNEDAMSAPFEETQGAIGTNAHVAIPPASRGLVAVNGFLAEHAADILVGGSSALVHRVDPGKTPSTSLYREEAPMNLENFNEMLARHREGVLGRASELMRESMQEMMADDLQVTLNGGTPLVYGQLSDAHIRLLRRASLNAADKVRDNMLSSAETVASLLEHYLVPEGFQAVPEPGGEFPSDGSVQEYLGGAMLNVNLREEDGKVVFVPSLEAIESSIISFFDECVVACSSVTDPFSQDAGFEWSKFEEGRNWAEDERILAKRARAVAALTTTLETLRTLASRYEAHLPAIYVDVDAMLEELAPEETPLEAYDEKITAFRSAIEDVECTSASEVCTGILLANVSGLRTSMVDRATSNIEALLTQVLDKTYNLNKAVDDSYTEMSVEMSKVAPDTAGVLQLKQYIASCQAEMQKLEDDIATNKSREDFLMEHRFEIPDEPNFEQSMTSYEWPKNVQQMVVDAGAKAEQEYRDFQMRLKQKTKDFAGLLEQLNEEVEAMKLCTDISMMEEYSLRVEKLSARLQEALATGQAINEEEVLFNVKKTDYPTIPQMIKALEPFVTLWTVAYGFSTKYEEWMTNPFSKLDPEVVEETVTGWFKKVFKLTKTMQDEALIAVAEQTKAKVEEFRAYVPLINTVCNPGLRERHWSTMSDIVGFHLRPTEDATLQLLVEKEVHLQAQSLEEISDTASREHSLEKALDKMQADWVGIAFELSPWKETGTFILKGGPVDEAQALLDDHVVKAQAMKSSPFAKPVEDRIVAWEKKLVYMQDCMDAWLTYQSKWIYLEPVFGSEEILKQMPEEGKKFAGADQVWRRIMSDVQKNLDVLVVTELDNLLDDLQTNNKLLTAIEKKLDEYLTTKKMAFPRFFFLSNDELLEILSETKDPLNVQPFVKKCFESMKELKFEKDLNITGMVSVEGEQVPFDYPVDPKGDSNGVEKWLLLVEGDMKDSLHTVHAKCVDAYKQTKRADWILQWPGQVILSVSQIYWTEDVTKAIQDEGSVGLEKHGKKLTDELMGTVNLVRGELTKLQRATIGALVVIDVHARDVVVEMADAGVERDSDFKWLACLRYYWEVDNSENARKKGKVTVLVRMLNALARYAFEYLGNSGRLVITPLTDRCYRTLLGAIHLCLGGAPAGPAGTGKTETTKDLSKAVAIMCVVFNCSDSMDYIMLGKFFKGLSSCGAWACFDEFNRIELEVLSVVAQQVLTIQRAVAQCKKTFIFEGVELNLLPTVNVFITMNPGYAGRSELPDNLKALFRDVAMMVPDYAMIGEIILYSFGYLDARNMARKLVMTYKLCSEQLSKQDHYDYGMRAVVSVLRAAGNLKRKPELADLSEDVLMLRSIQDVNLPKFLDQDVPLFKGILSDLFPGVVLPEADYDNMLAALNVHMADDNLQPLPGFIEKIIQLYEMIVVRHGLMIVGDSFGMKTCMYRTLAKALGELNARGQNDEEKVKIVVINPKSVTMGQLYGEDDPISKEWTDGVLAVSFRKAARDTSPDRKWVLLDGPVDAIWIENMNTVLDDNKKLCLNSGEIIAMQGLMNMIFEVQDLAVASPATVSRCGMVYTQPSLLQWRPLVVSWMNTIPETLASVEKHKETIMAMADWLVPVALRIASKGAKQTVPMQAENLTASLLKLYESHFDELGDPERFGKMTENQVTVWLECLFIFSVTWTIGAITDNDGRIAFDAAMRNVISGNPDPQYKAFVGPHRKIAQPVPGGQIIHNFVFNRETGKWAVWSDIVDAQEISVEDAYTTIVVQTMDTIRYKYLTEVLVTHGKHTLYVGPTGTGKSVYNKDLLFSLPKEEWAYMLFTFSAQTSANMTQDIIDGGLDKRRKGIFGPPPGKRMVVFVDDLSMPQVEVYGAQPPIELLRQFMDHDGWYDRKENTFRKLVDVQFLAAMGSPGGGRNNVTNRYLRHFNVVAVTEFDESTMSRIFGALVNWWFQREEFGEDITKFSKSLVSGTLAFYATAQKELLPTPAKSHYTFNLRDVSKVFQGISMASQKAIDSTQKLMKLWIHETMRIFSDRLTDEQDREWFAMTMKDKFEANFRDKFAKVLQVDSGPVSAGVLRGLLFGDFMIAGADPMVYDEIPDHDKLLQVCNEYLNDHNSVSKKPMPLTLFMFALEHVARICRIIKQPGGHGLLVGVGGSGRQSLTRLAAFMEEFEVFQIELTRTYGKNEWRDDLKKALRMAGEQNKSTIFLFADTQIAWEGMVEDIGSILNTAEVPNLFDGGDMATILENIRNRAKAVGQDGSRDSLYNFFVSEVRQKLHIVMAFSPVSEEFRVRLRKFPSLVTCTTIDWFSAWPNDALLTVANAQLADLTVEDSIKPALAEMCVKFHSDVADMSLKYKEKDGRYFYVTPTSYLELISSYLNILGNKQDTVSTTKKRYEVGLEKLLSTESQVNGMKAELEELQPKLVVASKETDDLIAVVQKETIEADKVKVRVSADEASAAGEAAKVKAIKDECEADLAEAIPALNAALKALDTLTKNDIVEVKGMKSPPAGVKLVMEAVCILKGLKPARVKDKDSGKMVEDYWVTSVGIMQGADFLPSLKEYDKDNIDAKIIARIRDNYTSKPEFDPALIKKASNAAFGLCQWVRAMDSYDRVAKVVAPKKASLAEAEATLSVVMVALAEKQAELKTVVDKLEALDAQLQEAQAKKAQLEADVDLCSKKLGRAEKLISGLGGEKTRWTAAAQRLGGQMVQLTGDVLLSCGMIAYMGVFTSDYRQAAIESWTTLCRDKKVPCNDEKFSLEDVVGDAVKIRAWNIDGLPKDSFSAENGIIADNSSRFPYCIDPQGAANKWIRNMAAHNKQGMCVVKMSDSHFLRELETSLSFGKTMLIEGLGDTLETVLDAILLKQTFKQGGGMMVRIGDSLIEWSNTFRLYLTTKLRNPHLSPETCTKICFLNFAITPSGLEDQLLGIIVAKERPDLEEEKNNLIIQGAENKRQLKEIEDKILMVLSSSEGNILEDEEAVAVLSASKVLSDEIAEKQKIAEETEKKIDNARVGYQPLALYVSVLFFCVADLANIDPMYQYSLAWFVSLFVRSIADAEKSKDVPTRLTHIREHFTFFIFKNVCQSLFERHKLLFGFIMSTRIQIQYGDLEKGDLRFLLTGGVGMENPNKNPTSWLADKGWDELCRLDEIEPFSGIKAHFEGNVELYKVIYDAAEPHEESLPGDYQTKLKLFQRICVLRCIRPDKVVPAVTTYVTEALGKKFVEPQPFNIGPIYEESSPGVPLLFVLSPGSDPMASLLKFADDKGVHTEAVSLGQGQGPVAKAKIKEGVEKGHWVVLQNCHLAKTFLPDLEILCEKEITKEDVNPQFRLWLSSYPSPIFPVAVLENAVKMTNEAPAGLRAGLERIYAMDPVPDPKFFNGCTKPEEFRKMLFSLAFFHCTLQQRRMYGPIGWNIPYEFNENDLRICVRQLSMFLDEYDYVNLEMLHYTAGECNYGGKVTDGNDRRLMNAVLSMFYCENCISVDKYRLTVDKTHESDVYVVPPHGEYDSYLAYMAELPIISPPMTFGFHRNADITKQIKETNEMLDTFMLTQSKDSGAGGKTSDQIIGETAEDILRRLPPNYDLEVAEQRYPVTYLDSMNTVLVQELGRVNILLSTIRDSLVQVGKAVKGLVTMSDALDVVAQALLLGKVPASWLAKSFPSLKPLPAYVKELIERCDFFQTWLDNGHPISFWLSGFFFTQAFTTAAKQNYARKYTIEIDMIDFDFFMKDNPGDTDERPEDGVLVYGMFLEGAKWDYEKHALAESDPKVLFTSFPPMLFLPEKTTNMHQFDKYEAPLYKTSERRGILSTTGHSTNFVCAVLVPSNMPESHWINRGTALLTSLDD